MNMTKQTGPPWYMIYKWIRMLILNIWIGLFFFRKKKKNFPGCPEETGKYFFVSLMVYNQDTRTRFLHFLCLFLISYIMRGRNLFLLAVFFHRNVQVFFQDPGETANPVSGDTWSDDFQNVRVENGKIIDLFHWQNTCFVLTVNLVWHRASSRLFWKCWPRKNGENSKLGFSMPSFYLS